MPVRAVQHPPHHTHRALQVDLSTSSIRPGQPPAWQAALQTNLQAAVRGSTARIKVITGTWQHDVDQANLLGSQHHVVVKVRRMMLQTCYD